jgi:hypothetical protein
VVETNIHHPTDSTLLGDGVRVPIARPSPLKLPHTPPAAPAALALRSAIDCHIENTIFAPESSYFSAQK